MEEAVYYKGQVCGTVRKYSDILLIFLLKSKRPDTYRDHQAVDVTLDLKPIEARRQKLAAALERVATVAALMVPAERLT